MNDSVNPPVSIPRRIDALFDHLLATRRSPLGQPYSITDVSKATGLSVPYLSHIHHGKIAAVPFQKVELLARFFGVPLAYFSQDEPSQPLEDATEDAIRRILAEPYGRDLVLRIGDLSSRERALILQMVECAQEMADSISA